MKTTKKDIKWKGRIKSKEFENLIFDNLVVRKARVIDTSFKNIDFKNSYLGFNSRYDNSKFENCKFYGKYSSLGSSSKYINCKFINCNFNGVTLFEGQHFINCSISGEIKNAILRDSKKIKRLETIFKKCNLSDLIFNNVNIYGKEVFQDCIMPKSGIRNFKNDNNSLIIRAKEICSRINIDAKTDSEILFNPDLREGQNPIIFDKLFLDTFFKTDESKEIFNEIIDGYEI